MSFIDDLYEEIRLQIIEETLYYRHYIGEVVDNNDSLKKGRVKVTIPELGLDDNGTAIWCFPRQGHSMSVPKKGEWAEIYFINADPEKPVYLYPASEIAENTPKGYTGDVKKHTIFEDPENEKATIVYDGNGKELQILQDGEKIVMLAGNESYVLGETFVSWLANFINAEYSAHTHLYNPGPGAGVQTGVPSAPGTAPTNNDFLSTDIKGK